MNNVYISWSAKKINDNCFSHPNTWGLADLQTSWQIILTETAYQDPSWVYFSMVEYEDNIPAEVLSTFLANNPEFKFKVINEVTANKILQNSWTDAEWNYYVTVSNFIISDNRPIDIF